MLEKVHETPSCDVWLTISTGNLTQPLSKGGGWDESRGCLGFAPGYHYHQPSNYCKGLRSIVLLILPGSFTVFFLPPTWVATCHTACNSARVTPSGDFCLLSKGGGWARVISWETPKWHPQIRCLSNWSILVGEVLLERVKTSSDSSLITKTYPSWGSKAGVRWQDHRQGNVRVLAGRGLSCCKLEMAWHLSQAFAYGHHKTGAQSWKTSLPPRHMTVNLFWQVERTLPIMHPTHSWFWERKVGFTLVEINDGQSNKKCRGYLFRVFYSKGGSHYHLSLAETQK